MNFIYRVIAKFTQIPQQMRFLNERLNAHLPLRQQETPFQFSYMLPSDRAIETQNKVNSWDGLSIWRERLDFTEKKNKISQKRVRCEIKSYKQKERKMKQHKKSKLLVLAIKDHCIKKRQA